MTLPIISIIIPVYNRSEYAEDLLNSILNQSVCDWEVLLIDDGSKPEEFSHWQGQACVDERFQLYTRNRLPKGAPTCRNIGIEKSRGKYVMFIDSDDLLCTNECLKERLDGCSRFPDVDFWVFATEVFRDKPGDKRIVWNIAKPENDLDRFLNRDNPWSISGPLWRREAFERLGPHDETLPGCQDWELHVRALCLGLKYRRVSGGLSYWRETQMGSISSKLQQSEMLEKVPYLYMKIANLLRNNKMMDKNRNRSLAKLYLIQGVSWSRLNRYDKVVQVLNTAVKQQHLSIYLWFIFFLYILSGKVPKAMMISVWILSRFLHEGYFPSRKSTYLTSSIDELKDWELYNS